VAYNTPSYKLFYWVSQKLAHVLVTAFVHKKYALSSGPLGRNNFIFLSWEITIALVNGCVVLTRFWGSEMCWILKLYLLTHFLLSMGPDSTRIRIYFWVENKTKITWFLVVFKVIIPLIWFESYDFKVISSRLIMRVTICNLNLRSDRICGSCRTGNFRRIFC